MKIRERIKKTAENILEQRPVTIGFLGDSVTQGCFEVYRSGENSLETEFSSISGYHQKLKQLLETVIPRVPITIVNAGISGDNAVSGSKRIQRDIISYQPDLCVVCFGLNDVNNGLDGLQDYVDALKSIFSQLNEAGIDAIFMTPNMMGTRVVAEEKDEFIRNVYQGISSHQTNGDMDIYMAEAKKAAREAGIPVCDCYAKWKKLEENGADVTRLLSNRINHPTEAMHWLFAHSLFEMIMGF